MIKLYIIYFINRVIQQYYIILYYIILYYIILYYIIYGLFMFSMGILAASITVFKHNLDHDSHV